MKNIIANEVNSTEIENPILLNFTNPKDRYMNEYIHHDGENFITFNIVEINTAKCEIIVAVSCAGKLSEHTFDLLQNNNGYYFEYGMCLTKIFLDNFEQVEEEH